MNEQEVLSLKAGRELDALVAEKVMGWVWMRLEPGHVWGDGSILKEDECRASLYRHDNLLAVWGTLIPDDGKYPHGQPSASIPYYSTDIAAAWQVVEKLRRANEGEYLFTIDDAGTWYAKFLDEHGDVVSRSGFCDTA